MAEIKVVYDQKTGAYKRVELVDEEGNVTKGFPKEMAGPGKRDISPEQYKEFMDHIEKFSWRQHEHIVLCHRPGSSVCTVIINGRPVKCC